MLMVSLLRQNLLGAGGGRPYRAEMLKLMVCLVLGAAWCVAASHASAQTGPSWERVMALPSGTAVHVKAAGHGAHCKLKSVDADSLTCDGGGKTEVFKKADIRTVKVPHRGRSALAGAAIGGGTGAAIGAGVGQNGQIIGRGGLAAIFGIPLAVIGALVGVATDFTVATIYKG
jgi:hypothetical protein